MTTTLYPFFGGRFGIGWSPNTNRKQVDFLRLWGRHGRLRRYGKLLVWSAYA